MSGWADKAIADLRRGEAAEVWPRGASMEPLIRRRGARVVLEPVGLETELAKGDVVLCKVSGQIYLHLVGAVDGARYRIENRRGYVNGWVGRQAIYGRATRIENPS